MDEQSIFSHGEREVAALLRDGYSIEEIADARDEPSVAVEKARARIRTKTHRALTTLLQSPDTEAALAAVDPADRDRFRDRIDAVE
jgi:DNA-binding NarL/FixJ family response regulator